MKRLASVLHDHRRDLGCWFGLSYASYLTLPRSLMEAMPEEWQARMATLLYEISDAFEWPKDGTPEVRIRDSRGRYVEDPLRQYRHPFPETIAAARVKPWPRKC